MSNRRYPPAYLRYLKARLLILLKPSIWGTAIFLSVIGLVIREYWYNPNMFTYQQNEEVTALQPGNSSLSPEERAIAADIDNSPVLFNDLAQGDIPIIASIPPETLLANNQDNLLPEANKQQSTNSAASVLVINTFNSSASPEKNRFVSEAEDLLQSGGFNSNNNQFLGVNYLAASFPTTGTPTISSMSGIGVNQTDNSENSDPMSFSQTPFNPSSNQSASAVNGETANQINFFGQTSSTGVTQMPNYNSLPETGLNGTTGIQPSVGLPNNLQPNSFNNINNIQELPRPVQPNTLTSPVTSGIQTGVQTNMTPNSMQPPMSNNVAPISPVVADRNGNLIWRSPSQQMQSNSSDASQTPAQDTGRVQNNNLRNLRNLGF